MEPSVSVIVPLRAGGPYLRECLEHLARQSYRAFDVYVVPDEPEQHEGVHVLASGRVRPNRKRRLAAEASRADIVALLDDDAFPAPDWLAAAVRHFDDPRVVAAGGPALTPASDSARARASGAVYGSTFVSASTALRYRPRAARDVTGLPSCNLLVRRAAFLQHVDACTQYWPGEDMLLCLLLQRDGGRIVYDPDVLVYHHRRALFAAHLRQVWRYAVFRGFFVRRFAGGDRNAAYAAPVAFAFAHALVVPALLRSGSRRPAVVALALYAGCIAVAAVRASRRERADVALVAAGMYLTHLTFGVGCIAGWLRDDLNRDG